MSLFMDHQRAGIQFALARRGSVIAAGMGTGKTLIAITSIASWFTEHPEWSRCLVVAPASVKGNWLNEFNLWLPQLPFRVPNLSIGIAEGSFFPSFDGRSIVIMNYDLLHRPEHQEALYGQSYDIVILDEFHMVKERSSLRTRHIIGFKARKSGEVDVPRLMAKRKMVLSGTPILNRPAEIWPALNWVDPANWSNFWKFAVRYCGGKRGFNNSIDTTGASNLDELYQRLQPIMFRVLTKDVLPDLPPITRQVILLPPPESAKPFLDAENSVWKLREETIFELRDAARYAKVHRDDEGYKSAILNLKSAITLAMSETARLRKALGISKCGLAIAHCKSLLDGGEDKLIVFCHHRAVVSLLSTSLSEYGVVVINGSTQTIKRTEIIREFQANPAKRIIVCNLQSGSVGVNLTAARYVIFVETDWRPGVNDQAECRSWRKGQTREVRAQYLFFDGSIDARMAKRCLDKQQIIDEAIDNIRPSSKPSAKKQPSHKRNYEKLGEAMTPDDKLAVVEAIRYITKLDIDGAKRADGLGFSKLDTETGRRLSGILFPSVSQYGFMLVLATKYRKQIPDRILSMLPPVDLSA